MESLAVPLTLAGNRFATVADGSRDEVRQNVQVVLSTRVGERIVSPSYGVPDPTFRFVEDVWDAGDIEGVVARWEPRALIEVEVVVPDGLTPEPTIRVFVDVAGD